MEHAPLGPPVATKNPVSAAGEKPNRHGGRPLGRRSKFANDIKTLRGQHPGAERDASLVPKTPLDDAHSAPYTRRNPRHKTINSWDKLNEEERAFLIHTAMEGDDALAFTLNLSPDIVAKATTAKRKARDVIRDRITLELNKLSSKDHALVMVLELSKSGRLHVHGSILAPDIPPKSIKEALRRAGGVWPGHAGGKFQADVQPLHTGATWHQYVAKQFRRMCAKDIKTSLSMNRAARSLGRQLYSSMMQAHLVNSIMPAIPHLGSMMTMH